MALALTNGRQVREGWRTSAPTCPPIKSTHQSQMAAQRTACIHHNHFRFRPGTGAKAEKRPSPETIKLSRPKEEEERKESEEEQP